MTNHNTRPQLEQQSHHDPDLDAKEVGTDEESDNDDRKMSGLGDQRRLQWDVLWLLLP